MPIPVFSPAAPSAPALARAGLATFARVADEWRLDSGQQMALLGLTSRTTFFRWKKAPPSALPPDLLERLSHVFSIYKSLAILLPGAGGLEWIHQPNRAPLFEGRPALDLMLSSLSGLYLVRAYLDAERGGDFA